MDDDDRAPRALDREEQKQADDAAPLGPRVVHEVVREEGETAVRRSAYALAWSGFAAGGSMGLSFLALVALLNHAPIVGELAEVADQ